MKYIQYIAYFIVIYVVAFVVWWAVLLNQLERQNFDQQRQLIELKATGNDVQGQINNLEWHYARTNRMIIYEGLAFLVLLIASSIYVINTIRKQHQYNVLQRNFLLATTHELKTPLAVSKLNIQTIKTKQLSDDQVRKLLDSSLVELNRLNNLVDNILMTSNLDTVNPSYEFEDVDLNSLINQVIIQFPDQEISEQIEPNLKLYTDPQALKIILSNLIDNAIKYSESGSPIEVTASNQEGKTTIEVKDLGIGIPVEEYQRVFERFYRIGDERVRNTRGTGLGLYLVKQLTTQLGGKIKINANKPQGTVFTIIFEQRR